MTFDRELNPAAQAGEDLAMSKQKKLFAQPVSRIKSRATDAQVGWVYCWNDGTSHLSWFGDEHADVVFVPMEASGGSQPHAKP